MTQGPHTFSEPNIVRKKTLEHITLPIFKASCNISGFLTDSLAWQPEISAYFSHILITHEPRSYFGVVLFHGTVGILNLLHYVGTANKIGPFLVWDEERDNAEIGWSLIIC